MNDSTFNTIYHRHRSAIGVFANGNGSIATDAALMSLALALEEAASVYNGAPAIDQRLDESRRLQLMAINDWLCESDAYDADQDNGNTAQAMIRTADELRRQVTQLQSNLAMVLDERNTLRNDSTEHMAALGFWLQEHMLDMLSGAGDVQIAQSALEALRTLHQELTEKRADLATTVAERDESDLQLAKLANWLDNEGETGDGNEVEIAISVIERLREDFDSANRELTTLIAERDDLRKRLAKLEFDVLYGNGKSTPAATLVQASDAMMQNPTVALDNGIDWSTLSQQADDYRIGIEANRWKYGKVPKQYRLELLRCAAAHIAAGCGHAPPMAEFDAAKPQWMSTSTAHTQTFGQPWHLLIDSKHEIEVRP